MKYLAILLISVISLVHADGDYVPKSVYFIDENGNPSVPYPINSALLNRVRRQIQQPNFGFPFPQPVFNFPQPGQGGQSSFVSSSQTLSSRFGEDEPVVTGQTSSFHSSGGKYQQTSTVLRPDGTVQTNKQSGRVRRQTQTQGQGSEDEKTQIQPQNQPGINQIQPQSQPGINQIQSHGDGEQSNFADRQAPPPSNQQNHQGQQPINQGQQPINQGQQPINQGQQPNYQGQQPNYQGQQPGFPGFQFPFGFGGFAQQGFGFPQAGFGFPQPGFGFGFPAAGPVPQQGAGFSGSPLPLDNRFGEDEVPTGVVGGTQTITSQNGVYHATSSILKPNGQVVTTQQSGKFPKKN